MLLFLEEEAYGWMRRVGVGVGGRVNRCVCVSTGQGGAWGLEACHRPARGAGQPRPWRVCAVRRETLAIASSGSPAKESDAPPHPYPTRTHVEATHSTQT